MHIADTLDRAVRLWPDREAVVTPEDRLTYREFGRRVDALTHALIGAGVPPGGRVAILLPNSHEFLEAYHAIARAGLVSVPINHRLAGHEVALILEDSGVSLLVAHPDLEPVVTCALTAPAARGIRTVWAGGEYEAFIAAAGMGSLPRSEGDDELAHLYYTSGTTGRPKGVMLTHRNVVSHARGTVTELQLSQTDTWAHVAPLFHLADAWATFAVTMAGGRHVIVPRFDAARVLRTFRHEGVTLTNLIPTMLNELVHHPDAKTAGFPSLRMLLSGGAPIAPQLVRRIMETFGCDYVQTYGMTETSPYLTLSLLKDHLRQLPQEEQFRYISRTGREFITVSLRVVDDQGREVAHDDEQVGEIRVKGDSVTPGYWNDPGATADAFEDGWLKTGDLAVIDAEGYVNIVDRKKDLIVTGGENVYSTEVENALYEHPDVLETAVIGVPDERWGEAVKAIVVLHPGRTVTEDQLIAHCRARLSGFKTPKSVDFLSKLPRTGSGKLYKKGLKDRYWGGQVRRVH